jgi:hypothetical protein
MNIKIKLLIEKIFFENDVGEIWFYKGAIYISTHWKENGCGGQIRSGSTTFVKDYIEHPEDYGREIKITDYYV